MLNLSGIVNVGRLFFKPSLCMPQMVAKEFLDIPIPICIPGLEKQRIRGIVVDKDNCLAQDQLNIIWPQYEVTWRKLLETYLSKKILIVSNTAGTNQDADYKHAHVLEKNTGVPVLKHSTKKPGCYEDILSYFKDQNVYDPREIAIVGDRLLTDILMANIMDSTGIWIRQGINLSQKVLPKFERLLFDNLTSWNTKD